MLPYLCNLISVELFSYYFNHAIVIPFNFILISMNKSNISTYFFLEHWEMEET